MTFPRTVKALAMLRATAEEAGLPATTVSLVEARVSQINGCGLCLDMHTREARTAGETDQRLLTLAAWRDVPYFTDAERAAVALAEAATRLADRPDPVPDAVWADAAAAFGERELAALVNVIAAINAWNRLNVVTGQVGGDWVDQLLGAAA